MATVDCHRVRHIQCAPSGIVATALHPDGSYLAVLRGSGSVELWMTDGQAASPLSAVASALDSNAAPGWAVAATVPGSAHVPLQCLAWAPIKSRAVPGVEGCRLFAASLSGSIVEVDFVARDLRVVADSNAGSVWSLAAFSLAKYSGQAGAGALFAAGCEDGSVRLFALRPASTVLTLLASCPGTEGRVMAVGWHPTTPALFAGTATGSVRGFDLGAVAAAAVAAFEAEQGVRSAAAASRARQRAAAAAGEKEEEGEEAKGGSSGTEAPRTLAGPRPSVHFSVEAHALGKRGKGVAACVWCLAVSGDMLVLTGDSTGSVCAWEGRTGVAAASTPIARHMGDVLALALAEGVGEGARLLVASGGADGRVVLSSTVPSSVVGGHRAWARVGAHSAHVAPVRALALSGRAGGEWIVSGGADGCVCSARAAHLAAGAGARAEGPRRYPPVGSGRGGGAFASSPSAGLIATYTGGAVCVWGLPEGDSIAGPSLLLQIDTPRVGPGAEAAPLATPSALALSADGTWLAYAGGSDVVPRLVRLALGGPNGSLLPTAVPFIGGGGTSAPSTPSHLALVALPLATLLLAVGGGRLAVYLLTPSGAAWSYSLPMPGQGGEGVRAHAGTAATALLAAGGEGEASPAPPRRRSATVDSSMGPASEGEGDEEGGWKAGRGGSGTTNAITLPFSFSAAAESNGSAVTALLATSTRHVHVYTLRPSWGELAHSLPRLPSAPSALTLACDGRATVVLTRDGGLTVMDTRTGAALTWGEGGGGNGGASTLPRALASRLRSDPPFALLSLPGCVPGGARLVAIGSETLASISVAPPPAPAPAKPAPPGGKRGRAAAEAPPAGPSSALTLTTSVAEGFRTLLFGGLASIDPAPAPAALGAKRGRGGEGKGAPPSAPALVLVELPWRAVAAQLGLGVGGDRASSIVDPSDTLARQGQGLRRTARYGRG